MCLPTNCVNVNVIHSTNSIAAIELVGRGVEPLWSTTQPVRDPQNLKTQPRTLSKHSKDKFDEQRAYLDDLLDRKETAGMYVKKQDISIKELTERLDKDMIVNFKDNRDPEKTWNDQKRSLFVGDLYSGDATEPFII